MKNPNFIRTKGRDLEILSEGTKHYLPKERIARVFMYGQRTPLNPSGFMQTVGPDLFLDLGGRDFYCPVRKVQLLIKGKGPGTVPLIEA